MKNLLIIYPHWPPSNLAGVHRARLIANFLEELGWHPIVLTVSEAFYEEKPDHDLVKTIHPSVEVIKTKALPISKILGKRVIGDIGLRGFPFLYTAAKKIIKAQQIDFIWIPIPAWYTALLGRLLHQQTGVPYGIDYIDPWVSSLAAHQKKYSKAWLAVEVAKLLEPIAVKNAALITGVSTPYYQGVLDRNFKNRAVIHVGMPYGFNPQDHQVKLDNLSFPWPKNTTLKPLIYAGAFLPQSHLFVRLFFKAIAELKALGTWDEEVRLYFIGTGPYGGKSITDYAAEYHIADLVTEVRDRFPFLHILNFLSDAHGVMVIGSTEKHYTASKIFQSLLSGKPVFSIFHHESTAVEILNECNADQYTALYKEEIVEADLLEEIKQRLLAYLHKSAGWSPRLDVLEKYSAKASAKKLVWGMEKALGLSQTTI